MAENIGYMLNDVGRLMRKRFDEMCQDLGVTSAQWRALFAISRRPGLNQGMLAELLEVEPITTCRMVDRLEQAGLVERRPDPNDRRAWQLFLGQAAMPLLDRLQERSVEMRRRALKGLSEEEIEALTSQLEVIRNNLSGASEQKEASNG
ncbi:MarR family transcriptional regulator [Rhizorhapis sp.]|uniref:MarR family winged helix-turn-helix transcriptional regulator n=1 Tax=Rhizorhapis sp. TaxID=1968842 RepID=UPI002B461272|nr:MarR family transcriptional regulator [Rhizorhapis sp.]